MTEKDTTKVKSEFKLTLIDLMMIIMIVGLVLTVIIPLQQTRRHESLVRESLRDMIKIIEANEDFKLNSGWDDYAMDLGQLDGYLRDLGKSSLNINTSIFAYTLSDTIIVATSEKLDHETKSYYYDMRDQRFRVSENSKDIIFDAWLP